MPRHWLVLPSASSIEEAMADQSFPFEQSSRPTADAVLVSGASFAGLATAYWMNRLGYRVTVIDVASGLRKGGTPVDIEGETIGILARMGMIDAVRAKALPRTASTKSTATTCWASCSTPSTDRSRWCLARRSAG
jgi:2-polyprenyl-6-methoxyphenol hydroxylase-like FAD-dependent oxidoreductase